MRKVKKFVALIFQDAYAASGTTKESFYGALATVLRWPLGLSGDVSEKHLMRALDTVRCIHLLLGVKVIFDAQHDACFSFAPYMQLIPDAFERTKNLSAFARDTKNSIHDLWFSQKQNSSYPQHKPRAAGLS